jgi:hypothetical protein
LTHTKVIFISFSDTVSTTGCIVSNDSNMKDDFLKMWKETDVAQFKILFRNLLGETD